jgi:hypothetical protein
MVPGHAELFNAVLAQIEESVGPASRRRKLFAIHAWGVWCRYDFPSIFVEDSMFLMRVPKTELLLLWVAQMAQDGITPENIEFRRSVVCNWYIAHTGIDPRNNQETGLEDPRVKRQHTGIKKKYTKPVKIKTPITPSLLKALFAAMPAAGFGTQEQIVFRAATLCALFGLMRVHEILPKFVRRLSDSDLLREDLEFRFGEDGKPTICILNLKKTKTDAEGKGVRHAIHASGNPSFCPVVALHRLFVLTHPGFQMKQPLFRKFWGKHDTGANYYSGRCLANHLKQLGALARIKNRLTPHGLRVGGATSMASLQCSGEQIRIAGRWKSDAYRIYTQHEMQWVKTVAERMGEDGVEYVTDSSSWQEAMANLGDTQEDEEDEEVV